MTAIRIFAVFSIFLFIHNASSAQIETTSTLEATDDNPYRNLTHSLGFGIVGGGEMTQYGFLAMPGLGYKYFTKSGAFRVMVGGIIDSRTDSWAGGSSSYGQNAINVHAGYQYHVMLGRFMPILGVDAHAGNYESFNNYDNGYNKESSLTIGISPNLGLEFWIRPTSLPSVHSWLRFTFKEQCILGTLMSLRAFWRVSKIGKAFSERFD
jgi:hypothetical protein